MRSRIIASRLLTLTLALVTSGILLHIGAPQVLGRTDDKSKPIVFIHGYEGKHCDNSDDGKNGDFEALGLYLRNVADFTGNFHWVEYLNEDDTCNAAGLEPFWNSGIWQYGTHNEVYGHSGTNHDNNTDYRHIAWHLAWFLHDWYAGNPPIDVVAHSAGADIIRYALAKQGQSCGCSLGTWPLLNIEDVVTVGGANAGVDAVPLGDGFVHACNTVQCQQLREESWMNTVWFPQNAMNPQGVSGTDWTVIGSEDDEWVTQWSATAMSAHNRFRYDQFGPGHAEYMTTNVATAGTEWYSGAWHWNPNLPGPQMLIRKALIYGSW